MSYQIYCDGSCTISKDCVGGWAYIILKDGKEIERNCGGVLTTTNQKMELFSAIKALEALEKEDFYTEKVEVFSDSAYLVNCYLQKWWKTWLVNSWKNSNKKPVANQGLWERLIPFFKLTNVTFNKVKGHSDNELNNECDKMAQNAKKMLIGEIND